MKTMLGIDPGTACGWALLRDGKLIEAGAWDLGARRHEGGGMRFLRLRSLLAEVGRMSIDAVAYEEIRRHMGVDAAHIYGGIIATLSSWCEERGTPYQGVPVGTVKKLATGKGNAEKVYMLAAALEKWPTLRESKVTHDVADACWIAETAAQRLGWWGGALAAKEQAEPVGCPSAIRSRLMRAASVIEALEQGESPGGAR